MLHGGEDYCAGLLYILINYQDKLCNDGIFPLFLIKT
jgi:hypothetical protein